MSEEIWKPVVGYESFYDVSNLGRVRTYRLKGSSIGTLSSEPRLMRDHIQNNGYKFLFLSKGGVAKRYLVHRLVAEAFIPNPDHKRCVDHINTVKWDNRVENLRWVTHSENSNNPITRENAKEGFYNSSWYKEGRCRDQFIRNTEEWKKSKECREHLQRCAVISGQRNSRSIICVETGEVYESIKKAKEILGVGITDYLYCGYKTHKGKHYLFVDELNKLYEPVSEHIIRYHE